MLSNLQYVRSWPTTLLVMEQKPEKAVPTSSPSSERNVAKGLIVGMSFPHILHDAVNTSRRMNILVFIIFSDFLVFYYAKILNNVDFTILFLYFCN